MLVTLTETPPASTADIRKPRTLNARKIGLRTYILLSWRRFLAVLAMSGLGTTHFPCFPFFVVHFPYMFPVVPGGRVAMIAMWTPLSSKYSKEVTDHVAVFAVAFGTHAGFCIEPCCGLPCFLFVLIVRVVWFCINLSVPFVSFLGYLPPFLAYPYCLRLDVFFFCSLFNFAIRIIFRSTCLLLRSFFLFFFSVLYFLFCRFFVFRFSLSQRVWVADLFILCLPYAARWHGIAFYSPYCINMQYLCGSFVTTELVSL